MGKKESNMKAVEVNSSCKVEGGVSINTEALAKSVQEAGKTVGASNIIAGRNMSATILESSNLVSSSISKMANSNYSISKSIKQGSLAIFKGLEKISDEMERSSKIEEYHMLQKEIEEYEDWLMNHGLLKHFYDNTQIEEMGKVQISQEEINFITSIFCGEEASSAVQLMIGGKDNIIKYYLKNLIGKKLYLKNKQIVVEDRVLINNYEGLGRVIGTRNNTFEFVIDKIAIKIESDVDHYFVPCAPRIISLGSSLDSYCDTLYTFMIRLGENPREAREKISNFNFYMIPSRKELAILLKKINCPDVSKLADLQRTISLINVENDLNNLRNLHEQLRLAVREYKMSAAMA